MVQLEAYDEYIIIKPDGGMLVRADTPENIKNELKEINADYKKARGENLLTFERGKK